MTKCWSEGDLRAYFDRELAADEMQAIEAHLADCAACATAFDQIAWRAQRVQALIGDLDVAGQPVRPVRARRWVAIAALAAAVLLAILLIPRHGVRQPAPKVAPAAIASAPRQEEPPQLVSVAAESPAPARPARSSRRPKPKSEVRYYLALDDEPIDTGMVMRVALAGGMQADVVVDSAGRPRAIRPVQ
jgi:hypothetical protein